MAATEQGHNGRRSEAERFRSETHTLVGHTQSLDLWKGHRLGDEPHHEGAKFCEGEPCAPWFGGRLGDFAGECELALPCVAGGGMNASDQRGKEQSFGSCQSGIEEYCGERITVALVEAEAPRKGKRLALWRFAVPVCPTLAIPRIDAGIDMQRSGGMIKVIL